MHSLWQGRLKTASKMGFEWIQEESRALLLRGPLVQGTRKGEDLLVLRRKEEAQHEIEKTLDMKSI
jgi:hypothetical protein